MGGRARSELDSRQKPQVIAKPLETTGFRKTTWLHEGPLTQGLMEFSQGIGSESPFTIIMARYRGRLKGSRRFTFEDKPRR